jgi:DNA-binding transcriptional regulator/RsmH inhibitor MraZ
LTAVFQLPPLEFVQVMVVALVGSIAARKKARMQVPTQNLDENVFIVFLRRSIAHSLAVRIRSMAESVAKFLGNSRPTQEEKEKFPGSGA